MNKLLLLVSIALLTGCTWSSITGMFNQPVTAAPHGDTVRGEEIYKHGKNNAPPCVSCHTLKAGGFGVGPALQGVVERAGSRISGLAADEYLRQSILAPDEYVVSGYRSIMYPKYGEHFDEQDMADLLAYISGL